MPDSTTDLTSSAPLRPTLTGRRVTLRPGRPADIEVLRDVLAEPHVSCWWGEVESAHEVGAKLLGESYAVLLVVEVGGEVAGGIEYAEENDPKYRHAGIDIYLRDRSQGHGIGQEAVELLTHFLFERRGHHRLTIDPAVSNLRAIRCYEKAGFQRAGVMHGYELGADGTYHDNLLMELLRP